MGAIVDVKVGAGVGIYVGAGSTQIHSELASTPQDPPLAVLKYTYTEE